MKELMGSEINQAKAGPDFNMGYTIIQQQKRHYREILMGFTLSLRMFERNLHPYWLSGLTRPGCYGNF